MNNPINYADIVSGKDEVIKIGCRQEICQGGPVVGRLFINGNIVFPNLFFGGPFLERDRYLYISLRKQSFLLNGFILTKINLDTLKLIKLNVKSDVINLKEIDSEYVYFSRSYFGKEKIESLRI